MPTALGLLAPPLLSRVRGHWNAELLQSGVMEHCEAIAPRLEIEGDKADVPIDDTSYGIDLSDLAGGQIRAMGWASETFRRIRTATGSASVQVERFDAGELTQTAADRARYRAVGMDPDKIAANALTASVIDTRALLTLGSAVNANNYAAGHSIDVGATTLAGDSGPVLASSADFRWSAWLETIRGKLLDARRYSQQAPGLRVRLTVGRPLRMFLHGNTELGKIDLGQAFQTNGSRNRLEALAKEILGDRTEVLFDDFTVRTAGVPGSLVGDTVAAQVVADGVEGTSHLRTVLSRDTMPGGDMNPPTDSLEGADPSAAAAMRSASIGNIAIVKKRKAPAWDFNGDVRMGLWVQASNAGVLLTDLNTAAE